MTQPPAVKTKGKSGKPPLYNLLGPVDSERHKKFVRETFERGVWFAQQNQGFWNNTERWHKLYQAQRAEFRQLPEEAWRAKGAVPLGYAAVETKTAIITDILTSIDPAIQAEGVGDEDVEPAMKVERLLDYTIRSNKWKGRTLPGLIRMAGIQGTEYYKTIWVNDAFEVEVPSTPEEAEEFTKRLDEAMNAMGIMSPDQVPDWLTDPENFMAWREEANLALTNQKIVIPEPPIQGKREIVRYRGPKIERIPLYDVFLDPLVDDIQDQVLVVHRMLKTEKWVRDKVKSGAWDGDAVEASLAKGVSDTEPNRFDQTINNIFGVPQASDQDPTVAGKLAEVWECWQPGSEVPYAVMINRNGIVNKDPGQMPYSHGQIAIGSMRNVYFPGRAMGISELQINEWLFEEMDVLRGLRLDRTKMETLPAFQYQRSMMMPELRRKIAPAMLVPTDRPNAFAPLIEYQPTNAFADMGLIERNIADATATYDSTKGAPATVNRVAASESVGRMNLANIRHKLQAVGFEEDLSQFTNQAVALWFQKGDPDIRVRIGGKPDVATHVSKTDLLEALGIDFRFRGATQAINRDTIAQKLIEVMKNANPIMTPVELRGALSILIDQLGIKPKVKLITSEGDAHFQKVFELTAAQLMMQGEQMKQQAQAALVPTPQEVSVEDAAALAQPGNGGPPAGPPQGGPPQGPPMPPPGMVQ